MRFQVVVTVLLTACSGESSSPPPPPPAAHAPAPVHTPATPLPVAAFAGLARVDALIWPTGPLTAEETAVFCSGRQGEDPAAVEALLAAGTLSVAVAEVSAQGALQLGGEPATPEDFGERLSALVSAWSEADAACLALQGGLGIVRLPELALAVDPAAPIGALRSVLVGVGQSGVRRLDVLVSGPPGERLPQYFEDGEQQLHASPVWLRRRETILPMPPAGAPLPVGELLEEPERLGCALVSVSSAEPWSGVVGLLDRLAAVGARRGLLMLDDALPVSSEVTPSGPAPALRLGGGVSALLLDVPQLRAVDPDGGGPHESECDPVLLATAEVLR